LRGHVVAVAGLCVVVVGVSRVYLGVHWPTDVLAGWAVGGAWALAFWIVADRMSPPLLDASPSKT